MPAFTRALRERGLLTDGRTQPAPRRVAAQWACRGACRRTGGSCSPATPLDSSTAAGRGPRRGDRERPRGLRTRSCSGRGDARAGLPRRAGPDVRRLPGHRRRAAGRAGGAPAAAGARRTCGDGAACRRGGGARRRHLVERPARRRPSRPRAALGGHDRRRGRFSPPRPAGGAAQVLAALDPAGARGRAPARVDRVPIRASDLRRGRGPSHDGSHAHGLGALHRPRRLDRALPAGWGRSFGIRCCVVISRTSRTRCSASAGRWSRARATG
jgi:hypothetical protein